MRFFAAFAGASGTAGRPFRFVRAIKFFRVLTRHLSTYYIIHSMYCMVSGKERTEWISNGKGPAGRCVLAVLRRGPSYGYKIIGGYPPASSVGIHAVSHPEASGGKRIRHHGHTGHGGRIRRYFTSRTRARNALMHFWTNGTKVKRIYAFIKGKRYEQRNVSPTS